MTERQEIAAALQCCRQGKCSECPLQEIYCDDLIVDTAEVPVELLEKAEEELCDK